MNENSLFLYFCPYVYHITITICVIGRVWWCQCHYTHSECDTCESVCICVYGECACLIAQMCALRTSVFIHRGSITNAPFLVSCFRYIIFLHTFLLRLFYESDAAIYSLRCARLLSTRSATTTTTWACASPPPLCFTPAAATRSWDRNVEWTRATIAYMQPVCASDSRRWPPLSSSPCGSCKGWGQYERREETTSTQEKNENCIGHLLCLCLVNHLS